MRSGGEQVMAGMLIAASALFEKTFACQRSSIAAAGRLVIDIIRRTSMNRLFAYAAVTGLTLWAYRLLLRKQVAATPAAESLHTWEGEGGGIPIGTRHTAAGFPVNAEAPAGTPQ
jgi:hypothetical protein